MCCAVGLHAQVEVAGDLLVSLDPSTLPPGSTAWITNSGTLGGVLEATGLAPIDQPAIIHAGGAAAALMFDGHNFMQHVAAPGGSIVPAPPQLVGNNPPCSIEAWVLNPTVYTGDMETIVAWGTRDVNGGNMAFGYGVPWYGGMQHWTYDFGWSPVPAASQWHHLVYTFDGATARLYADGALNSTLSSLLIDTVAGPPITLAAQRQADGTLTGWGALRGSLSIGRLRIHSAALTDGQVRANYEVEKGAFALAAAPFDARPAHRYSFNLPATNDAVGTPIPDSGSVGGADAMVRGLRGIESAMIRAGKLSLAGGASSYAAYVDLPNRMLSSLSAGRGGSGQITLEGWVTATAGRTWGRLFDFGNSTAGELGGAGGSGNGTSYFMLSQVNASRDWHQCEVHCDGYNGGPDVGDWRSFGLENNNAAGGGMTHFAVTWSEATGEVVVYENGIASTRFASAIRFDQVDDVNVWLGRSNWTADENFQGDWDELRIYTNILSPAQVLSEYLAGPDLLAYDQKPAIVAQPQSQTVAMGYEARVAVTALGGLPLSYQWQLGGTNLLDATNGTLVLPNTATGRAGDYRVVITNAHGSATSQVATLTVVVPAPVVFRIGTSQQETVWTAGTVIQQRVHAETNFLPAWESSIRVLQAPDTGSLVGTARVAIASSPLASNGVVLEIHHLTSLAYHHWGGWPMFISSIGNGVSLEIFALGPPGTPVDCRYSFAPSAHPGMRPSDWESIGWTSPGWWFYEKGRVGEILWSAGGWQTTADTIRFQGAPYTRIVLGVSANSSSWYGNTGPSQDPFTDAQAIDVVQRFEVRNLAMPGVLLPTAASLQVQAAGDELHFTWEAAASEKYILRHSSDLLTWSVGSTAISSTTGSFSCSLAMPHPTPTRFWRLERVE